MYMSRLAEAAVGSRDELTLKCMAHKDLNVLCIQKWFKSLQLYFHTILNSSQQ